MRISDWSSDVCSSDLEDAREDQVQARHAAAGDPVLRTVDDIAVAAPVGPRRHLGGRTAGAGLGDADGRLVSVEHQARSDERRVGKGSARQGGTWGLSYN